MKNGRLPKDLLPLQSGVGNMANAVLAGLMDGPFDYLTSYTEVIQDGMVDLIDRGQDERRLRHRVLAVARLREPDERRGTPLPRQDRAAPPGDLEPPGDDSTPWLIACNGMIEADMYGNVNSTHIMGSRMQNGIGGSADFTRNSYISAFVTPSVAKGGAISCIVPMVSHHDHTEHDVQVLITEQGLADLRGLPPDAARKKSSTTARTRTTGPHC